MIIQCVTNSFRSEMLQGIHDLSTDVLKLALYTGSANLYPTTTAYSTTNEVAASGYTAGGLILTGVTIITGTPSTTQPAPVYVNFNKLIDERMATATPAARSSRVAPASSTPASSRKPRPAAASDTSGAAW